MKFTLIVKNEKEMSELGTTIGRQLEGGETIALSGNLGAGKTTLAKAILQGAGVTRGFSPTFILSATYPIKKSGAFREIHHLDLYRLKGPEELMTTGLYDAIGDPASAVIVEWADRFPQAFENDKINVIIEVLPDQSRSIQIEATGEKHEKIARSINRHSR